MNRPCLNISTCNRWMEIRYRNVSDESQVLRIVIKNCNLFVDGQIDRMRGRTTCIIRPNGVHRLSHVDRRCS